VSIWKKIDRWRKQLAKFHYRQAGQLMMARRWFPALGHFGQAAVLQPEYTWPRLWMQMAGRAPRSLHD